MWSVIAMTSKCPVFPYRSITSRTDSFPSLQRVCTWKSQSRNGSYPGTLGPHIEMLAVSRAMPQNLGPEVPNIQGEHAPLAHGHVPPGRRPDPAAGGHLDAAHGREPPAEIRILAVEFNRLIEAADARERIGSHREIAAVQNRAETKRVVHQQVRGGGHQDVVEANQHAAAQIPVVKPVRAGHTDG